MFITVENLRKSYQVGEDKNEVLRGISLTLEREQIGVILGPSGSGKSALMNIIGDVDRTDGGDIHVDGLKITSLGNDRLTNYRRDLVGFIFQFYNLVPNLTVTENIEAVSNISKTPLDMNTVLNAVGFESKRKSFPRELSGGEQQHVTIAHATVENPKLLLYDEPTDTLGYETAHGVLSLLQQVNRGLGTTVLMVTHSTAIGDMTNVIYRLRDGEIVEAIRHEEAAPAERTEW